jgi:hypothetical protein
MFTVLTWRKIPRFDCDIVVAGKLSLVSWLVEPIGDEHLIAHIFRNLSQIYTTPFMVCKGAMSLSQNPTIPTKSGSLLSLLCSGFFQSHLSENATLLAKNSQGPESGIVFS